jgi:predicted transcriptional regulator
VEAEDDRVNQHQPQWITDEIVALLRAEGPLSMPKIAAKLGRNPGGIRDRLLRMASTGRVIETQGPNGRLWSAPPPKEVAVSR